MPAAEAGWFGDSDVPEDGPELRLHAKRSRMVPDLIRFRVCSGSGDLMVKGDMAGDHAEEWQPFKKWHTIGMPSFESLTKMEPLGSIID